MISYNAVGDAFSVTDPSGNVTTSTYDLNRRPVTVTSPATQAALGGIVTAFAYDADGRVIETTSTAGGLSSTSRASYTLTGKVATATDANGNVTRYSYDVVERVSSVKDPLGRQTNYTYDAMSRKTGVFNTAIQAGALLAQAYTPDGLLASLTDANANATTYAYDGFDRLSTTAYPGGSTETQTYDANGNVLTRTTRAKQTINYAYDTLNRLITKTPPSPAAVVSYAYDLAGRVIGVSDTSSSIVSAVPPSGGTVQYATTATYDQLNRPLGFSFTPAPTPATPTGSTVTFTHGYNAANQRISQAMTDNTWLQYPSGPSTTSYTANTLNQYTAVGAVKPTYDANGNLTFDGTFTFGYDAENRLVSASGAGNTVSYVYDAQGRRKSKTVNGTTTLYVTDADNREVLEYNGTSGQIQAWYAYGPGSNEVLNRMDVVANTRQTFVPDLQGSIVATMESGTGVLTKRGYLPYGESGSTSGSFAYTGLRIDPETSGHYYARARMYSPALGRFVQPDPIGYAGGINLYAYGENDPLNYTDPSGEIALIDNVIGAGIAITVDLVAQYAQARSTNQPFQVNVTRTAVAGLAGFVTSGASALLGTGVSNLGLSSARSFALRTTGDVIVGAAGNVAQTATLNRLEGTNNSLTTAALIGGAFGGVGSAVTSAVVARSAALNRAAFSKQTTGDQNLISGIAELSGFRIGASPFAAALSQQLGQTVSSGSSFFDGTSGGGSTNK